MLRGVVEAQGNLESSEAARRLCVDWEVNLPDGTRGRFAIRSESIGLQAGRRIRELMPEVVPVHLGSVAEALDERAHAWYGYAVPLRTLNFQGERL